MDSSSGPAPVPAAAAKTDEAIKHASAVDARMQADAIVAALDVDAAHAIMLGSQRMLSLWQHGGPEPMTQKWYTDGRSQSPIARQDIHTAANPAAHAL